MTPEEELRHKIDDLHRAAEPCKEELESIEHLIVETQRMRAIDEEETGRLVKQLEMVEAQMVVVENETRTMQEDLTKRNEQISRLRAELERETNRIRILLPPRGETI